MYSIITFLLVLLVISLTLTVMLRSLLQSAICLGVGSVILTIIFFLLGAPWAAVFELSVCAGLITAIFVSAIAMSKAPSEVNKKDESNHYKRFSYLPFILGIVAVIGVVFVFSGLFIFPEQIPNMIKGDFADMLWNFRQVDVLGQIFVVLAGVFAVVVLLKKERESK